ncbi:glycosyltransferase [Siphonobacter curvatus]|uniref:Glycosyl transferase family 1 n=1 Tax=Siphonobacter curvatus TaxID=2094562 RepID=A0A2S7IES7_9BACT|nr:glycosyltransferase [Siphonobacter curvatus]PQA53168.1 glycosyl transferase family 1 [Siphonobacter curvatus]
MRLLHVIDQIDLRLGGVSQAVHTMMQGLDTLHVTSEVVSSDVPASGLPDRVHALGPSKGPWHYNANLRDWLQANLARFDTILVHGLWQYHTFSVYQVWKQLPEPRPKLFVMPHGMLDPYFQKAKGRKLKALRNWLFWKAIERHLINHADGLLFTCEAEKTLARQTFRPYQPRQETVVGMGVLEPPVFQKAMTQAFAQACERPVRRPYWLFLSRIDPKKGLDLLIEAYVRLSAQYPQLPALVIAGPGLETSYGQAIRSRALAHTHIVFAGMLTGAAKWGAFYGCQAMVLPSHQENFGIAIVEALACGKPVLISQQVNIWQEISQGQAGLVAEDTLEGTYRLLKTWLELSPIAQQTLAERARQVYEQSFAVAPTAHTLVETLFEPSSLHVHP